MMILISTAVLVLLCASGIQGELLRVYKDIDFRGQSKEMSESTPWVGSDWNDQISSVDAILGTWRLFEHRDYKGESMLVCSGGKYSRVDANDAYTSMKLVSDTECGGKGKLRVYKEFDFEGKSKDIIQSTAALERDWNDQISSVDVISGSWRLFEHRDYKGESMLVCPGAKYSKVGYRYHYSSMKLGYDNECGVLRVYKDYNFGGQSHDFYQNTARMGFEWNDEMSSVDVISGSWRLYTHADYKGDSMLVCSGSKYSALDTNDAYSSVKLVSDDECGVLRVYKDYNFGGQSKEMSESTSWVGSDWNDQISSVYVISGNWMLFTNSNYEGESMLVCSGKKYPSLIANDAYSSMRLLQGEVKGCYQARGRRRG